MTGEPDDTFADQPATEPPMPDPATATGHATEAAAPPIEDGAGAEAASPVAGAPTADGPIAEGSAAEGRADEAEPLSVESLVESLELVSNERDGYLDSLRRLQAEFENYKKAVAKREADARDRANEGLVNELLPVLDACDGAVANGAEDVVPVKAALNDALVKHGLSRLEPDGQPFDPEHHEAVMHEDGETEGDGPVVAEVLRVGFQLKGRTIRAAMVRTRG